MIINIDPLFVSELTQLVYALVVLRLASRL